MNFEYEASFVNKFIQKNRRPRLLYELSSADKRKTALSRFCHNSLDHIEKSKIIYAGNKITIDELDALIRKHTSDKMGYLLSWDCSIDGCVLEREKALRKIIGNGMISIMVFTNLAVIETEQTQGAAIKYVLVSGGSRGEEQC